MILLGELPVNRTDFPMGYDLALHFRIWFRLANFLLTELISRWDIILIDKPAIRLFTSESER